MKTSSLNTCFPQFEKKLIDDIEKYSVRKKFLVQEYIVKEGELIHSLPIVLSGNVKVFSLENDIQFLLYHMVPGEFCVCSFAHTFNKEPAEFSAVVEIESDLLLLPLSKVKEWMAQYPSFGNLVLVNYQKHYKDLLNMTKQVVCYNLEDRLIDYLESQSKMKDSNLLNISHQEIADDLGTSREVITRIMKKLSKQKKVMQIGRQIKWL